MDMDTKQSYRARAVIKMLSFFHLKKVKAANGFGFLASLLRRNKTLSIFSSNGRSL